VTETRPTAVRHDAEFYRSQRAPASSPEPTAAKPEEIKPPQIAHYVGPHRPAIATLSTAPIRVTRQEIEAALVNTKTYNPHTEDVVDRIVLETSRLDQEAAGTPEFNARAETIRRLLRELGLYPLQAS
jgi:hypothetical protein